MRSKIVAACALAALGTCASAQTYVGIGLGASHGCAVHSQDGQCSGNAASAKATLGYAVLDSDFAVEAIYDRLGTFKASSPFGSTDVKIDTLGAGGVWRPAFGGGWSGVLRGGVQAEHSKVTFPVFQPGSTLPTSRASQSKTFAMPYAGVGVTYAFTPKVHFETSLDFTRVKAYGSEAPNNITSVMVGGIFGF